MRCLHIFEKIVNFLQEGEVNPEDLKNVGLSVLTGAGEGYLRGGIAAIITASCKSGLLGDSLKSLIPKQLPLVVAGATIIAMNAVHNAIGVYKGKMSEAEFAEACLRDSFVISFGILGASIGQGAIPIPILGALIGNVIGSICATIVYEGMKDIFFSFFIKSGVSFWKIVQQDYTLPEEVLKQTGIDLIKEIRRKMQWMTHDHLQGVAAYATYELNGKKGYILSKSGLQMLPGSISINGRPEHFSYIFEAIKVGYDRFNDAERKIIEILTDYFFLFYHAEGTINIFIEQKPCGSCENILNLFDIMFPDVEINWVWEYDSKFERMQDSFYN